MEQLKPYHVAIGTAGAIFALLIEHAILPGINWAEKTYGHINKISTGITRMVANKDTTGRITQNIWDEYMNEFARDNKLIIDNNYAVTSSGLGFTIPGFRRKHNFEAIGYAELDSIVSRYHK